MARRAGAAKPPAALLAALRRIGGEVDQAANGAQLRFFDAMEAGTGAARLREVAALLSEMPLSGDAWGYLAAMAPEGSPLALALWRQAVAAGTLQIGPLGFQEMAGQFWGFLETRPYMRARAGLAQELRAQGAREDAVAELRELLALNPDDNQGLRYLLLGWLLEAGAEAEAAALLQRYEADDYAGFLYGRALLEFRREGGQGPAARRALEAALAGNPHLAPLLTGAAPMPKTLPEAYSPGEASEAQIAWREMHPAWSATPGALDWLRAATPAQAPRRRRGRDDGG